jgi:hypothetical protein
MNAYPSWIQRIPEMIEALALAGTERIDRQAAERLFELRATAAKALLRRLGAELCGHALVISRARLMARLREALEHPDWKWEAERRRAIRHRVQATRPEPSRRSVVPVTGEFCKTLDQMSVPELPATIELLPGTVTIRCRNMAHLLEQLVQLAKALDNDYETLQRLIEPVPARRPVRSELAEDTDTLCADALG